MPDPVIPQETDESTQDVETAESTEETTNQPDDANKSAEELAKKLADKAVQAEIDRRVTDAIKKTEARKQKDVEKALEDARVKAEEAKLLEDGKTQELYELEKQKREELEAKVQERERLDKVSELLDHREVFNPVMRDIFQGYNGSLTDLSDRIDAVDAVMQEEVEKRVTERLGSTPPPKRSGSPEDGPIPLDEMTPEQWAAHKKANKIY